MTGTENEEMKKAQTAAEQGTSDAERTARQRKRSIAIAVSLALLAVLFYVATLVKMTGGIAEKAGS